MAEQKKTDEKSPEELDKQIQEENRKKSEERAKLVDGIVDQLHAQLDKGVGQTDLQTIVKEVADRIGRIQVVAAGAVFGPTATEAEELRKDLPRVVKPMSDGTPVANISQAPKEGDKPEEPKESVGKSTPSSAHASKK